MHNSFDFFVGADSHRDDCVAIFGHVTPLLLANLTGLPTKHVCALRSKYRILHSIAILKSPSIRLTQAEQISQSSKMLLLDFLYSDIGKAFSHLSIGCLDDGLFQSHVAFLIPLSRTN